MDAVFKALADPTRRGLLDELFRAEYTWGTDLLRWELADIDSATRRQRLGAPSVALGTITPPFT
jgi:hypothetical protein